MKTTLFAIALAFIGLPSVAQSETDPEYVGDLSECTTIESEITKKCSELLEKGLQELNGTDGQIAVIDAKNGRLKAWVALEKKDNGFAETRLLKKAYSPRTMTLSGVLPMLADINASLEDTIDVSGKMTIREALVNKSNVAMYKIIQTAMGDDGADRFWQKMTNDNKATNAMEMAALLASVYKGNSFICPTLKGDSVDVEIDEDRIKPLGRQYMHEILLGLNQMGGIQSSYAPKDVELAGIYGNEDLEPNDGETNLAETSFAGLFPAKEPRYSICVFIHRPIEPTHSPKDLATSIVNELISWLMK